MIKDILYKKVGSFTVDLSGPLSMPIVAYAFGDFLAPADPTRPYFQNRDHIVIESAYISLPGGFCSWWEDGKDPLYLRILWEDEFVATYPVDEIHNTALIDGNFTIPVENTEIPLEVRIEYPDLSAVAGTKLKLRGIAGGEITMANVPAALDTEVIDVFACLKIRHNLPMIQ